MWEKFEDWLAVSPIGSFLKISLGAALGALLSWLLTADVHPLIMAIGAAVIPIAINMINPQDPRYGTVNWEGFEDA